MANIDNITVNGFKSLFKRDFPYLPLWIENQTYFKNDVVYYTNNFYNCIVETTTALPTDTLSWKLYNDSVDNYISDTDIERAFSEARQVFNPNFFDDDATAEMFFYYVTAHFLVMDINNAANSFGMGYANFTQSKSVGSVSESYAIPTWMQDNPIYAMLGQTGYGRKYLMAVDSIIRAKRLMYYPGRINFG